MWVGGFLVLFLGTHLAVDITTVSTDTDTATPAMSTPPHIQAAMTTPPPPPPPPSPDTYAALDMIKAWNAAPHTGEAHTTDEAPHAVEVPGNKIPPGY